MPCVYILTNPAMPDLIKIGFTAGDAADRAAQISQGTGVPAPFAVEWFIETTTAESAYSVERAAHRALTDHRINNNREFFKITVAQAAGKIEDLAYQLQATADSAIRHAYEEAERIKRAQAIQREAAERYQREAPQREAAERARREVVELARVERARAEAEQAEQYAAIRAQREAAARVEAARISRKKKIVWGSLVLVACFLFGTYVDHKRQKEQERYARAEQARAEQTERYAAIRAKREAAERGLTEKARADALRIEQACAPLNVGPLSSAQPSPWDEVAQTRFAREFLPTRQMDVIGFAVLPYEEREKLANEYIESRAKAEKMDAAQRKQLEAVRDRVVYADNGGRAPGRTFPSLFDAVAAIHKPTQDALLASQQRRQQMEACNKALVLANHK